MGNNNRIDRSWQQNCNFFPKSFFILWKAITDLVIFLIEPSPYREATKNIMTKNFTHCASYGGGEGQQILVCEPETDVIGQF